MLAVISDTHLPRGGRRLPDACLRLLGEADLIVHAGDFCTAAVLAELQRLAPVEAVHGNMDDGELRRLLPARHEIEVEGLRIGIVHDGGAAAGRPDRLRSWFPACDVIVYGHSHMPEIARAGTTWILNPGSPTERRRAPSRTIIAVSDGVPALVEV